MSTPLLKKCTPVLIVDAVEPSLAFFEALGLERGATVPVADGGTDGKERLAFAIVEGPGLEIMLQTAASVKADMPALEPVLHHKAHLFIEVGNHAALEEIKKRLADGGVEQVMAERTTPYGSTEVGYIEPGGHHVTFAAFPS